MKEKIKKSGFVRKLVSIVAAVLMTLGMVGGTAITAMAATNSTQKVTVNTTDHTYTAYQIFSGTQGTDTGKALGDVAWGSGIESNAFLRALNNDTTIGADFTTNMTAQQVADKFTTYTGDNSSKAEVVANIAAKHTKGTGTRIEAGDSVQLESGYYLIVDTTSTDYDDAKNSALLQVTGAEITIEKKYEVPSLTKKIVDATNAASATAGSDVVDKSIGDTITYRLEGTLPSNLSDYDTYKYQFHDTMAKGLAYQGDAKVYLKNDDAAPLDITSNFTITPNIESNGSSPTEIAITIANIKSISNVNKNSKIIVTYSAKLTADATVGGNGNANGAYVTYSNDPNYNGGGDDEPTSDTPTDKTYVFTFKLNATKIDAENENTTLSGAQFILKAINGEHEGKFAKITNGKISGWDVLTDNLVSSAKSDPSLIDSSFILTSADGTGEFSATGLAAGKYQLIEIKAPAGYNLSNDPVSFTITATETQDDTQTAASANALETSRLTDLELTSGETVIKGTPSTGNVAMNVTNTKGSVLPSTGGIGTTLFYVLGGVIVAGAVILLVAKRRKRA